MHLDEAIQRTGRGSYVLAPEPKLEPKQVDFEEWDGDLTAKH